MPHFRNNRDSQGPSPSRRRFESGLARRRRSHGQRRCQRQCQRPASVSAAGSVAPSATVFETPTESVFGAGSVSHAESIPSPSPARESAAAPEPAHDRPSFAVSQPPTRRGGLGVLLVAAVVGLGIYALISSGALDALLRPAAAPTAPRHAWRHRRHGHAKRCPGLRLRWTRSCDCGRASGRCRARIHRLRPRSPPVEGDRSPWCKLDEHRRRLESTSSRFRPTRSPIPRTSSISAVRRPSRLPPTPGKRLGSASSRIRPARRCTAT